MVMSKMFHREICPCKGKAQEPSKKLLARQADFEQTRGVTPGSFHKPGSQNRNK